MWELQVMTLGQTPGGWQGMGWHSSVPTTVLAEAALPRAV